MFPFDGVFTSTVFQLDILEFRFGRLVRFRPDRGQHLLLSSFANYFRLSIISYVFLSYLVACLESARRDELSKFLIKARIKLSSGRKKCNVPNAFPRLEGTLSWW